MCVCVCGFTGWQKIDQSGVIDDIIITKIPHFPVNFNSFGVNVVLRCQHLSHAAFTLESSPVTPSATGGGGDVATQVQQGGISD